MSALARTATGTLALALGFACGSTTTKPQSRTRPLPPAGSAQDDGTGMLARWSTSSPQPGDTRVFGATRYGGGTYASPATGGARYGGSRYARYRYTDIVRDGAAAKPKPYQDYVVRVPAHAGAIEGTVRWPTPPTAPDTLPITTGDTTCPPAIANDSLVLGTGNAVAHAVVFLEDIRAGHGIEPIGGVLERRDCALQPHVGLVAPIGSPLRFTNADPSPARYAATRDGDHTPAFELSEAGHGDTLRIAPDRAGFYHIAPIAHGDPSSAWVVVARHPYYTLTDARGRFRFDGVPPGAYTLRAWHAPVRGAENPRPITTAKRVRVTARKTSSVSVSLPSGR